MVDVRTKVSHEVIRSVNSGGWIELTDVTRIELISQLIAVSDGMRVLRNQTGDIRTVQPVTQLDTIEVNDYYARHIISIKQIK